MENTQQQQRPVGMDGFWRSEPLPEEDKPRRSETAGWHEGWRITAGFRTLNRSSREGRPPAAVEC